MSCNGTEFYAFKDLQGTQLVKVCADASIWTPDTSITSSILDTYGRSEDMNLLWVLISGALVFFMQTGFTLLEAGMVRNTSIQNILFKNLMDACIGTIIFYLFGYCLAFGIDEKSNSFLGTNDVAISSKTWNLFFFQWAFAATAATIVSGGVAERTTLTAYFSYTIWITLWVYPIIVHWIWSPTGWLSAFNSNAWIPIIDFAGSGVVHMVGGFSGLMGTILLKPRIGRFDDKYLSQNPITKHEFIYGNNISFQVLGTFILWFGWFGFNCGSTLIAQNSMKLASKIAVNTTISAALGGITIAIISKLHLKIWSIPIICNGILAGLVSITASCAVVKPWCSIFIGIIGAFVEYLSSQLLIKLKIDDPLDAFCVHGMAGFFGVLSVGIFGFDKNDIEMAGYDISISQGLRFGYQLFAAILIAIWTIIMSGILFLILSYFNLLTVDDDTQNSGMDVKHAEIGTRPHAISTISSLHETEDGTSNIKKAVDIIKDKNL